MIRAGHLLAAGRGGVRAALVIALATPAVCLAVNTQAAAMNTLCRKAVERNDESADNLCHRISFDIATLAPGSAEHIESLLNLGEIQARRQSYIDAAPYYERALAVAEQRGKETAQVADIIDVLADAKLRYSKFTEAEALLRRSLAIRAKLGQSGSIKAATARVMHADLLAVIGDFPTAESSYVRARDDLATAGPSARSAFLHAQLHLAQMYILQFRHPQAIRELQTLLEAASMAPADTDYLITSHRELGWTYDQLGETDMAVQHLQKAVEGMRSRGDSSLEVEVIEAKIAELKGAAAS